MAAFKTRICAHLGQWNRKASLLVNGLFSSAKGVRRVTSCWFRDDLFTLVVKSKTRALGRRSSCRDRRDLPRPTWHSDALTWALRRKIAGPKCRTVRRLRSGGRAPGAQERVSSQNEGGSGTHGLLETGIWAPGSIGSWESPTLQAHLPLTSNSKLSFAPKREEVTGLFLQNYKGRGPLTLCPWAPAPP
jgi:hypothetical protein